MRDAWHLSTPTLPEAARAQRVSPGAIQLTVTLYLIGLAIGQLIYGPIGLALFTLPESRSPLLGSAVLGQVALSQAVQRMGRI